MKEYINSKDLILFLQSLILSNTNVVPFIHGKAGIGKTDIISQVAETFGYVTSLRTISSGRATSTMEFSHYAEVSSSIAKAVVTEAKGKVELL